MASSCSDHKMNVLLANETSSARVTTTTASSETRRLGYLLRIQPRENNGSDSGCNMAGIFTFCSFVAR